MHNNAGTVRTKEHRKEEEKLADMRCVDFLQKKLIDEKEMFSTDCPPTIIPSGVRKINNLASPQS